MAAAVIIFDFDKTIIDCDSDNWLIDELGATPLFESLLPTMPWNTLMDRIMMELHAQGKTIDDFAEVLKRAPLDRHVASAIKFAHALGCDLRIVSDANVFYIETILKHHGLVGCFTEINTNPSYVDAEGRLRISPYHDFTSSSHGCPLCPPNMCKSKIMERIRAEGKKKIIYLGDGKGDYCPSLRLGESDFVMPRKNYPLWDLIQSDPGLLKAEVHEWSNGEELERVLLHLIRFSEFLDSNGSATAQLLSGDCKMVSMPGKSPEPLPKVLPVLL
ncbi:thiamine phosphate phosphatase-like protein [Phalaenopsis equestris]|uniref:thiamine phosphate phosphatase-like protein n=1 Tax=Phalaenopsis equestris TaxID=78828 RepID=UPI0009E2AAFD|nr:thiamine phosphate phosphatase-like protein [Phalaenopsis equestris]XP_020596710.1 thiamine phosphate phosphatase-like protein [Phalaenopsis equestris]